MRFKEKIKKIGNRKNCLLLALLILALLFTALMPKINLGTQKASALSAPQTKTLNLNGESYSYQTSLKELKNNYGFFNKKIYNSLMWLQTDAEGVNYATIVRGDGLIPTDNREPVANLLKNNIKLYNNNEIYEGGYEYDIQSSTDNSAYEWGNDSDKFNLTNLTKIEINIPELLNTSLVDNLAKYKRGCNVSFYYLNTNMPSSPTQENIYQNTLVENYFFTKPLKYTFTLNKHGYRLSSVYIVFETDTDNLNNGIDMASFYNEWPKYDNFDSLGGGFVTIKNLNFINNEQSNILKYDFDSWNYLDNQDTEYPYFKGSLLLSRSKMDANMLEYFNAAPITTVLTQSFDSPIFFGARNNTGKRVTNIYYAKKTDGGILPSPYYLGQFYLLFTPPNLSTSFNDTICYGLGVNNPLYPNNWITFHYQNQLLSVPEAQNLRISTSEYNGSGLSGQVEDILFNVKYLGNTEQIQQEQEIKKDFENMLYVTGAFAVIGLLLGFVFGNPILGLVTGAIIGFGLTIIPIILDGLQAIFGQQFLDGLQNFFRSIASAIAGVVSSILNFLFSIITNPAVLVLVLIVAILYLFVFRKDK